MTDSQQPPPPEEDGQTGTEPEETPTPRSHPAVSFGRWIWEWTKSLVIAFTLFVIIRTFVVEAFRIPTGSMENTLLVGDFLLVNKAVYGAQVPGTSIRLPAFDEPQRGDVIVFTPPLDPDKDYVKRVVGVPGDTLRMREKLLYVNGVRQVEPYALHSDPADVYAPRMIWQRKYLADPHDTLHYRPTRDNWGPIVVPPHEYFVLGDNRDDSEDSRYWGWVKSDAIEGKPLFVYYSFNPQSLSALPWLTAIRWSRIGGAIH